MNFQSIQIFIAVIIVVAQLIGSNAKSIPNSQDEAGLELNPDSSSLANSEKVEHSVNLTDKATRQLPPPNLGQSTCYPAGTAGQSQYLVGYGSLMQTASKDRTYSNTGESLPVRIYGYSRSWNCKGESVSFSTTYLGSNPSANKSSYFNGVVFKVPSVAALTDYDTRESFYCREEVPASKIQLLATSNNRRLATGQYWIYVTRPEYDRYPSRTYPIVQSYVDTFLSGCLELEDKFDLSGFSEECIHTTEEWVNPWVNDRIFPRRPFMHQPMAGRIDRLLNSQVPKAFRNIAIE